MAYDIVKNMAPAEPYSPKQEKTAERIAMEQLEVNDGFWLSDRHAADRARWARRHLAPKRFDIIKTKTTVGFQWQVLRKE